MKLWQKEGVLTSAKIEQFTVGRDREMDIYLAEFDVLGNLAHAQMLESIGLLTSDDLTALQKELKNIYQTIKDGAFVIEEGVEDVHSQVELLLTRKLGDIGKKIHNKEVYSEVLDQWRVNYLDSFARNKKMLLGYREI